MPRSAEDYGIYGLSDETLRELSGNIRKYGEKGRYALQELGQRRGLLGEADLYRSALERAAYRDAGAEYGAGLGRISNYLAGAGPLADSGAATALRSRLAGDIYGRAAGRIGGSYADFLGDLLRRRRDYNYQRALEQQKQKAKKGGFLSSVLGALGGIAGAASPSRGNEYGPDPYGYSSPAGHEKRYGGY